MQGPSFYRIMIMLSNVFISVITEKVLGGGWMFLMSEWAIHGMLKLVKFTPTFLHVIWNYVGLDSRGELLEPIPEVFMPVTYQESGIRVYLWDEIFSCR